ncbi:MAG: protein kinase [Elusimicrobia bacterium]|nr:protein kinase [Elusimicrobiota bacterium]
MTGAAAAGIALSLPGLLAADGPPCGFDTKAFGADCLGDEERAGLPEDRLVKWVESCSSSVDASRMACHSAIEKLEADFSGPLSDEQRRELADKIAAHKRTADELSDAIQHYLSREDTQKALERLESGHVTLTNQTRRLVTDTEAVWDAADFVSGKVSEWLQGRSDKGPRAENTGLPVSGAGRVEPGKDPPLKTEPAAPDPEELRRLAGKEQRLAKSGGSPEDLADSWRLLGRQYEHAGSTEAASRAVDRSIALYPGNPDAYVTRSGVRLAGGDRAGALRDAKKALELDPGHPRARKLEAALTSALGGGLDDKLRLRQPVFDSSAGQPAAGAAGGVGGAGDWRRQGGGAGRPKKGPPSPAELAAEAARRKLRAGDFTGAIVDLTRAIQLDPRNPAFWRMRAEASNRSGHHRAAAEDADRALSLDPDDPLALLERAYARLEQGDPAGALADARRAAELSPGNALAHLYMAMAKERLGDAAGAAADYEAAAKLDAALRAVADEAMARMGAKSPRPAAQGLWPGLRRRGPILPLLAVATLLIGFPLTRKLAGWTTRSQPAEPPLEPSLATLAERPAILAPGAMVGSNLCVVRELGRGGMGVVYEAFDTALHRCVAVKQLRRNLYPAPQDYERFLREARVVAKMRHPNIARIQSVVEAEGDAFLVFDLVRGRTLDAVVKEKGRLGAAEAGRIVGEVCAALEHAHGHDVIHRDLKPANVMLDDGGRCLVMDFGIAHQSRSAGKQTWTAAWGTPPYMAPEQELGRVSLESDLFAVGVMAYELLTGSLPFKGPNFLADKMERRWAPVTRLDPGLPAALDAFFAKALEPEPAARFRGARELGASFAGAAGA